MSAWKEGYDLGYSGVMVVLGIEANFLKIKVEVSTRLLLTSFPKSCSLTSSSTWIKERYSSSLEAREGM
jgi:hypothetical protein